MSEECPDDSLVATDRDTAVLLALSRQSFTDVVMTFALMNDKDEWVTNWPKGVTPIPAGAVSVPDAEQVARLAALGKTMRAGLTLTGKTTDNLPSGNVIGE